MESTDEISLLKSQHRLALAKKDEILLEKMASLLRLIEAAKPHCAPTSQLNMRVKESQEILAKHFKPREQL